jgi:hypothetical protein
MILSIELKKKGPYKVKALLISDVKLLHLLSLEHFEEQNLPHIRITIIIQR